MRIRDKKKEELVKQKAIDLLVKDGFEGFSMHKLAKAAKISPATLYIYYKDKDDLIKKLGIELGEQMAEITMKDFDPDMSFSKGLKKQWENRSEFWLKYPKEAACFDVIKHSPHCEYVMQHVSGAFRPMMIKFVKNAIENKELKKMSFEVYWSVAYGPLYNLITFHKEGRSKGNRPFKFSSGVMYEALNIVLKALKP